MDKEWLNEINDAYYRLEIKNAESIHALFHRIFELESGWFNGHYFCFPVCRRGKTDF